MIASHGHLMEAALDNLFLGKYAKGYVPGYCGFELRRVDQEYGAAVVRLMLFDNETREPLVHFGDFTVYVDTTLGIEDWKYEAEINLTSDGVIYTKQEERDGEDDEEQDYCCRDCPFMRDSGCILTAKGLRSDSGLSGGPELCARTARAEDG